VSLRIGNLHCRFQFFDERSGLLDYFSGGTSNRVLLSAEFGAALDAVDGFFAGMVSGYAEHGVRKAVVFLTPLNPTQLLEKGVKALGMTRAKAAHAIPLDIPADKIKRIPGGKGAYIWYYEGDIPLPKKGPFSLPTGL